MATAINQNNITDIIKFYNDSMKTIEKQNIDVKANKKSLHAFSSVSTQIIQFYKITNSIVEVAMGSGIQLTKEIAEAQKIVFESMGSVLNVINTLSNFKFPSAHKSMRQAKRLRREVYALSDIFLGPGGIARQLEAFNYLKHGGTTETYDEDGRVIKRTKIDSLSPADAVKGFVDLVDAVMKIIDNTQKLSKNVAKTYILTNFAWPRLIGRTKKHPGILTRYLNLINSKTFQTLADPATKKQINDVAGNIGKFSEIIETINDSVSAKNIIGLIVFNKIILKQIEKIIPHIIDIYNNTKDLKEKSSFDRINDILTNLKDIVVSIDELSGYKINARKSKKIINTIYHINEIIVEISNFASSVKKKKFAGIKPQIATIKSIIDSMLSLTKDIILLALMAIPLAIAILPAIGTLHIMSWFINIAIKIFNKMSDAKDYAQLTIAMVNITKMIGMILLMTMMVLGAMIIISLSLPLIIDNFWKTLGVFAIISALVIAVAGVAWLINKMFKGGVGKSAFMGLLLMTAIIGEMIITAGMLLLLAKIGEDFFENNKWKRALGMFAVVGAVVLAMALLGYAISYLSVGVMLFTASMALVTIAIGAIILIGYELKALANFEFTQEEKDKVKATTATIIGAAKAVMDGLFNGFDDQDNPKSDNSSPFAKFFKSIFKGAAFIIEALCASAVMIFTTVSVTMMLIIGAELKALANYTVDKEKAVGNANTIMSAANAIIDCIFKPAEDRDTSGGGGFIGALKHFFMGIADILELIAAVGKLALSMVAIAFVRLLGSELNWVAKFDVSNISTATSNAVTIMSAADAIIDCIFEPAKENDTGGGSKFTGAIKHFFTGLLDIIELIIAVGKLAMTLAAVALVKLIGNQLLNIAQLDVTGMSQAVSNVGIIMSTADSVIDSIFAAPTNEPQSNEERKSKFFGFIKNVLSNIATVIESIAGIGKVSIMLAAIGMVSFLAKSLKTINDISKEIDENTIIDNVKIIMTITNDVIHEVFGTDAKVDIDKKKLKAFDDMTKSLKKFFKVIDNKPDKVERNIDNTIKFIDRFDSIKIEKLETATNMFAKMAEFSKTIQDSFDDLADTINDKFLPALEEIGETIDKTNSMAESGKFNVNVTSVSNTVENKTANNKEVGSAKQETTTQTQPAIITPAQMKDYTMVINDIKHEIKKLQDILTDGTQKVSIDNH